MANIKKINGYDIIDSTPYSTSEIKTGNTWIDGKAIYRKVIVTENLTPDPALGDTKIIEHGITNMDKVISLKCLANNGDNVYFDFNNYTWYELNEEGFNSTVHVFVDNTQIIVTNQGTHYISFVSAAYFIIEYTKNSV